MFVSSYSNVVVGVASAVATAVLAVDVYSLGFFFWKFCGGIN